MITFRLATAVLALIFTLPAQAEEQTRFYAPNGQSAGTATRDSSGSIRFRDAQGRSIGTSSTVGGTTTFYDAQGRVVGRKRNPIK
jgi:YD repeat-containing protein